MSVKISELTASTGLAPTDVVATVNGGLSRKGTIDQVVSGSSYRIPHLSATIIHSSASFATVSASFAPLSASFAALSGSHARVSGSFAAVSGSYAALSASFNTISASYRPMSASFAVVSASYIAVSASYNTVSASYTSNVPRINGTVVLAVSGTNTGDIGLTGTLYASGAVYRRMPPRTISANGPIQSTDQVLFISCTANLVLTATNPAFAQEAILIKKVVDNAFTIQVARFSTERIEGAAATYTLTGSEATSRPAWTLMTDGTDWWIA